jgi:hypothetical protein
VAERWGSLVPTRQERAEQAEERVRELQTELERLRKRLPDDQNPTP